MKVVAVDFRFTPFLSFSLHQVRFRPLNGRWRVGPISSLVLVFAATRKEMALQAVLYNPIWKIKC